MAVLLDTIKLLAKKQTQMADTNARFKSNLALENLFASIPSKYDLLKTTALTILDSISAKTLNINDENLKLLLNSDNRAKSILKFTSNDLNQTNTSELLLACYGETSTNISINQNLDVNDILKIVSNLNDIDKPININKIQQLQSQISKSIKKSNQLKANIESQINQISSYTVQASITFNTIGNTNDAIKSQFLVEKQQLKQEKEEIVQKIQSYKYVLQHTINMTKDLLTTTDYPSRYRTKYIQNLSHNVYGLMKQEYDNIQPTVKSQYDSILNSFKSIDDILIAVTLVITLYLANRKTLSKKSSQTLNEISTDAICKNVVEPFDVSINVTPFETNLNCPVITDDVLVPHTPISEKLKNISCEVTQNIPIINDASINEDLITIAIIQNNSSDNLDIIITKDSFVNQKIKIANLSSTSIFSPVTGYIDNVTKNQIVIRDITDTGNYTLESQINLLNQNYQDLNNINAFIKSYDILTLYVPMLSISTVDDASTYDVNSGIDGQFNDILNAFNFINKKYNKQLQKITEKDNIEKHAKNETLIQIKKDIDILNDIFLKNIKLLEITADNAAKKTKAKSNEYELFEYYTLELGAIFNGLEYPTSYEIKFRDIINEFINIRYVLEGYNKNYLKKKISEQLVIINDENNINLFIQAFATYNSKKSISDLKFWLAGIANANKKLSIIDKLTYVNRIIFLFQLYLNADKIIQKYTILKKETSLKKQTIKEGNIIKDFLNNLWKTYTLLPTDIENIQNFIDTLSSFTTFSTTEYEGKQARLYVIDKKPKCESTETNPYLNPKSQYGYGDIEYWYKYCALATLASVSNPATGWSTGWAVPSPVLLPVVYIPIKPISTIFGFIVLGITICGTWIFPFTLLVNLSANFAVPFADPTISLKNEIQALKKEISDQLVNIKKHTIKPLLDKKQIDVKNSENKIQDIKNNIANNKFLKPNKYDLDVKNNLQISGINTSIKMNLNYIKKYTDWLKRGAELRELLITEQLKLFKYETEYSILKDVYDIRKSIKGITPELDSSEIFINSQLDKLNTAVDNMNKTLGTLPMSLAPETANFGFTPKNPKSIINIARELDDNINTNVLDNFFNNFRLKNSDFLTSNYENTLSNSILNINTYKKDLIALMSSFIRKDPFPSYPLLTPTNIPYLTFLYKDFITTGSQTYGFPGFPPFPL